MWLRALVAFNFGKHRVGERLCFERCQRVCKKRVWSVHNEEDFLRLTTLLEDEVLWCEIIIRLIALNVKYEVQEKERLGGKAPRC